MSPRITMPGMKSGLSPGLQLLALLIALALGCAGCVTKSKAKAQAREAFAAGQQQALMMNRTQQMQGPTVTVVGQVRNGILPWTPDLTVAKAIVNADYFGKSDPRQVYLVHNGKTTPIDGKQLLSGEDFPVQPGDVIQIVQ